MLMNINKKTHSPSRLSMRLAASGSSPSSEQRCVTLVGLIKPTLFSRNSSYGIRRSIALESHKEGD
jgi:hypothetical protein